MRCLVTLWIKFCLVDLLENRVVLLEVVDNGVSHGTDGERLGLMGRGGDA